MRISWFKGSGSGTFVVWTFFETPKLVSWTQFTSLGTCWLNRCAKSPPCWFKWLSILLLISCCFLWNSSSSRSRSFRISPKNGDSNHIRQIFKKVNKQREWTITLNFCRFIVRLFPWTILGWILDDRWFLACSFDQSIWIKTGIKTRGFFTLHFNFNVFHFQKILLRLQDAHRPPSNGLCSVALCNLFLYRRG